ncbi:Cytochrome P450 CYP2 subfamily [Handroanthus impetiginosus]|uniref:Flavonoid-6-hydroxylase n=1 Tax=Handroanthus impetiginosus TaxID=429701 RepID=A0A2G9GXN0_9LAMI|nr:Cytochrome P450 CYP2 subfamily [Handroanthus impetiginosus]
MEFSSSIYGAIAFFLLFYYYLLWSKPKTNKDKAPPEADGARPFTGHLHLMSGDSPTQLPHIKLAALADKYGPIFTIRFGVRRAVVVSSSELAKQLFTTCDVAVSSRPQLRAAKHLSHDFAMFGFAPYGAYWRQLRKLISVELLSSRRVELLSHVRVSEISQSINEVYKLWEEKRDSSGKVLVDMKQWFGDLNLNVVLKMVAGKRFHGGGDAEETQRCREVFREFFHLAGVFVAADALPYLGWLDLGGYEKRMKEIAKELDRIVGGWLAEHRQKEYSGEDKPRDFMDVLLSAVQGSDFQVKYDNDTIIKCTCETLIAGGVDTTTVMLVWSLSLLLNHRHVLKKVQQELDDQIGKNRRVTESDLNNLPYLHAVVKETLRLYPAGPLSGTREFSKDTTIGNYKIPKGTWLIVNLWKLQRDPRVWPENPSQFMPERFLKTHKNLDVKGQDFELIPFGAGWRICPGTNFGLQMMHLVLASLLQGFEVSTIADEAVDMTESEGLTNLKATPLNILVAPRLASRLY